MTDIGRSRRQWRQAFFILLGIASVVIIGLLIAVADKKVSYASESDDRAAAEISTLARLLEAQQPPPMRAVVLKILRQENPKARIFATDSTVIFGDLVFRFSKAGRLSGVGARE